MSKATTENSPDETKTCPLCGGRVFWFPVSNYWGCERCKNTFNRYTVFPDEVKKTSVSAVGNAAAMREALDKVKEWMEHRIATRGFEFSATLPTMLEDVVLPALAKPARNCDLPLAPLAMDGPANNNADKAWLVFRRHNPDVYFDVPGLLLCIEWLLAPAERKGERRRQ